MSSQLNTTNEASVSFAPGPSWLRDAAEREVYIYARPNVRVFAWADNEFVSSSDLAEVLGVTHSNMLRTLRSFEKSCGQAAPDTPGWRTLNTGVFVTGMLAYTPKGKPAHCKAVLLCMPALNQFATWLLKSLRKHAGTWKRRREAFLRGFGDSLDLGEGVVVAAGSSADKEDTAETGDRLVDVVNDNKAFNVSLDVLASLLKYSPRQLRRKLAAARAELACSDDADFLRVTQGAVSRKTAMFLIQSMPRSTHVRLRVFNAMYAQLRRPADESPVFTDCRSGTVVRLDDVVETRKLLHRQSEELHARRMEIDAMKKSMDGMEADNRLAQAAARGAEAESLSLRVALQELTHKGAISSPEVSDLFIHTSEKLRAEHGLVSVTAVVQEILRTRGDRVAALLEGCNVGRVKGILRVIRFHIGHQWLAADGQPVLRASAVEADVARAFRVRVPSHSSAGHRAKHGTEREWRWALFFTRSGMAGIVDRFEDLVENWKRHGCPNHMRERGVVAPSAMPESFVEDPHHA